MLEQKITDLITPTIEDLGYRLVRVKWQSSQPGKLQIMAERVSDHELAVEDCEKISRTVSAIMDVEDPIKEEYHLEVSSPGIDRPLVRFDDYERYQGFDAKIVLTTPLDGRKRFKGNIARAENDEIHVEQDDGFSATIPFKQIDNARLILTDKLIAFAQQSREEKPI